LRSGLEAQVHGVLAKQGQLPEVSDVFGAAGQAWLRSAPLDLVYRQRIHSLLELIVPGTATRPGPPPDTGYLLRPLPPAAVVRRFRPAADGAGAEDRDTVSD
jgi:hypothetical protein